MGVRVHRVVGAVNHTIDTTASAGRRLTLSLLVFLLRGNVAEEIVAQGTPKDIMKSKKSYTGKFLKKL